MLELVPQLRDCLRFFFHNELDHLLKEDALEFFESTRFQRAAFDDHVPIFCEQRVVLRFVTEHRVELLVEFDFDAGRQFFGETALKLFNC